MNAFREGLNLRIRSRHRFVRSTGDTVLFRRRSEACFRDKRAGSSDPANAGFQRAAAVRPTPADRKSLRFIVAPFVKTVAIDRGVAAAPMSNRASRADDFVGAEPNANRKAHRRSHIIRLARPVNELTSNAPSRASVATLLPSRRPETIRLRMITGATIVTARALAVTWSIRPPNSRPR